jgi:choline dehydrogenase-like flavoprotein
MTVIDPGTPYDAVIVGSGFGGSMVAQQLVDASWRVLMIERGGWVPRRRARIVRLAENDESP